MHISDFLPKNGLFDSHCHLDFKDYALKTGQIVENAKQEGLSALFNAAIDIESSRKGIEQAKQHPEYIKTFIGIDPEVFIPNPHSFWGLDFTGSQIAEFGTQLENLYTANKEYIIGIGETGMDFHWIRELDTQTQEKSKKLQLKLFETHLQTAAKFKLPLTIHSRAAETQCLDVLTQSGLPAKGIFHSFTGSYEQAKAILDSGNGLGVNGIITFKNADSLREVYKKLIGKVKEDEDPEFFYKKGVFFETDSPFLSPEGKRGETNYPFNVKEIYKFFVNYLK